MDTGFTIRPDSTAVKNLKLTRTDDTSTFKLRITTKILKLKQNLTPHVDVVDQQQTLLTVLNFKGTGEAKISQVNAPLKSQWFEY